MARQHLIRTFVLLLLLLPAVGQSQVTYDKRTGDLSVTAEDRPLTDVLAEVSAGTGIEISVAPGADRPVFARITSLPVEQAIRELIGPLNSIFVYQGNTSKVKAVKVYATSPSDTTARIGPPVAPPEAARSGQKLPPSQAELEARANQRWEQRATSRERQEALERRKEQEEERAAWEAREAALKAEQDKRMSEQHADVIKRLEEARKSMPPRHPGPAATGPPPPTLEEIPATSSGQAQ